MTKHYETLSVAELLGDHSEYRGIFFVDGDNAHFYALRKENDVITAHGSEMGWTSTRAVRIVVPPEKKVSIPA